ncbi:protein kinase [Stigmatella sp. ncwal1]|uniref:Protein kinase n=1 Tax=Stigmatella ashevillensis TaxID=2995309 RepID=A0ABT5D618_9BACT|nr:protein kinase [Stigmatella ashevillena]MDC0707672.1 protein kinase [Stigmatella ashevillena]
MLAAGMGMQNNSDDDSDFDDALIREVARSPPPLPLPGVGEHLGGKDGQRFEILAPLGVGSMGQVFRAWDQELRRVVALKFIQPHEALGEAPLRTLLREARAIAQLDHENIVRVFDMSEWSGRGWEPRVPFLIMECLQGESLSALLSRGRLPLGRALEIMVGIAAGLAHAHEHQVIHRDLKPSNVFINQRGIAKLLDFGLAHLLSSGPSALPHLPSAGTPVYMAPEQWQGEAQDERTDIWAAGAVLYEMLTGEPPYPHSTSLDDLRAQVASPEPVPSVRGRNPELPQEVEQLLATALAKEPARRFPTAQELGEELRELSDRFGHRPEVHRPSAPERRQVTLVSCALSGLALGPEKLDADDLGELEEAFLQCCEEIIQRHGGTIALYLGDEVLACFGYPVAREEDTERAVRAGLELIREVPPALQRQRAALPLGTLAVKAGIHTGKVALRARLREHQGGMLIIHGEALRAASWVASQAEPGMLLVSQSTWALVRGAFEARSAGSRFFESLSDPRQLGLYRVLQERPSEFRFDRVLAAGGLTPLVGRKRELRQLLEAWEQARHGHGSLVLVSGEAGIGKSRLIQELLAHLNLEEAVYYQSQCWPQFSASAFHPIVEMLRRRMPEDPLSGLIAEHAYLLGALLEVPVPGAPLRPPLSRERWKEGTLQALLTLSLRTAREHPVLALIEDVHWADPSTLEFLGLVLEHVERERLLIVLSARPDFRPAWPPRPWLHRMVLDRLPAELTARMVREAARGRMLPEETVQRLALKTDGIPLFVEEMTHMVLERAPSGEVPTIREGAAIPASLHELLLARLDLLPSRQRILAQVCAVVGRGMALSLPAAVLQRDEAGVRRDLEGLVAAGLLQPQGAGWEAGYQFRHVLLQDAALHSLPRSTRREYHRRIAEVLAERFPDMVALQPEVLAHHATEAGEYAQAIRSWYRAGQLASLRSANPEAVSHFQRALKLLRSLPDANQRASEELELLIALGTPLAQMQGYRSPDVERIYARARALFQQVGEALPQLELSYWGPFAYYFSRGEYSQAHELAERLVDLGRRQNHQELLALGHRMMASILFIWGQIPAALEHILQALENSHFELAQHQQLAEKHWVNPRVMALAFGAMVLSVMGRDEEAQRFSHEALQLSQRIGHPHTTASALTYVTVACHLRRDVEGALKWADEAIALASEHGFPAWQLWCTLVRIWALSERGHAREGLELMREGISRWARLGIRAGLYQHNLGLLAEMHLKLGEPREALELLLPALHRPETGEHFYEAELIRLRGEALRALGREEEARGCFRQALRIAHSQEAHAFEQRAREALGGLSEGASPSS